MSDDGKWPEDKWDNGEKSDDMWGDRQSSAWDRYIGDESATDSVNDWDRAEKWSADNDEWGAERPSTRHDEVKTDSDLVSKNDTEKLQKKIELGIVNTPVVVTLAFVGGFIQGGVAGFVCGGIQGFAHGFYSKSLSTPGFSKELFRVSRHTGRSFGLFLGSYHSSKTFLYRARGKSDIFNTVGAGFVAGSMANLGTRNPTQIMVGGLTAGLLMGVLELL